MGLADKLAEGSEIEDLQAELEARDAEILRLSKELQLVLEDGFCYDIVLHSGAVVVRSSKLSLEKLVDEWDALRRKDPPGILRWLDGATDAGEIKDLGLHADEEEPEALQVAVVQAQAEPAGE